MPVGDFTLDGPGDCIPLFLDGPGDLVWREPPRDVPLQGDYHHSFTFETTRTTGVTFRERGSHLPDPVSRVHMINVYMKLGMVPDHPEKHARLDMRFDLDGERYTGFVTFGWDHAQMVADLKPLSDVDRAERLFELFFKDEVRQVLRDWHEGGSKPKTGLEEGKNLFLREMQRMLTEQQQQEQRMKDRMFRESHEGLQQKEDLTEESLLKLNDQFRDLLGLQKGPPTGLKSGDLSTLASLLARKPP